MESVDQISRTAAVDLDSLVSFKFGLLDCSLESHIEFLSLSRNQHAEDHILGVVEFCNGFNSLLLDTL